MSLNTGNAILSNGITLDSSYNVGIGGAASGSYKLNVTGAGNFTGALTGASASFSSNVTTITQGASNGFNTGGLIAKSNGNTARYTQVGYDNSSNYGWIQAIEQGTAYTNLVLNGAGGIVLANRTSPINSGTYTTQKLQVTGGIGINSDAADGVARLTLLGNSSTGDGTIDWGGNGNFNLVFSNNGNERLKINSTGSTAFIFRNVSNEVMDLLVSTETDNPSKSKISLMWYGNETASIKFKRGGDATGGSLEFWTQAETQSIAQRMTILANGNVGIGTSSPSYKLSVQGPALGTAISWTDAANNTGYLSIRSSAAAIGADNNLVFETAASERMRITSSGQVGIGITNPAYPLSVHKVGSNVFSTVYNVGQFTDGASTFKGINLGYDSTSQTGVIYAETAAAASNIAFWNYNGSSWGERMRITGGGSVEIKGPTLSAGDPSTYALRVGESSGINLTLSWNSTAGYIQTFSSTPLYLNQQGNSVSANGTNGFGVVNTTSSDVRIKKNIVSIQSALDKVNALRGVYYEFDKDNELEVSVPYGKTRVGLIAQEVEAIIPEAVLDGDNENIPKSVDYTGLVGILVKAIQELKAEIEAQQKQINSLINR